MDKYLHQETVKLNEDQIKKACKYLYKKKICEVIEAFQWNGNIAEFQEFIYGESYIEDEKTNEKTLYVSAENEYEYSFGDLWVYTSVGKMHVKKGDYIVKCGDQDICACPQETFEREYEKVKYEK